MRDVDTVMFEGPLDEASSERIAAHGRDGDEMPAFVKDLRPEAIREIDRLLREQADGQGNEAWILSLVERKPVYFESFMCGKRPYAAFFSVWQICLGWKYSVDMDGYQAARKLGKNIQTLETLDEQLEVLDNISTERITRMLNDVESWEEYNKSYVRYYLEGDLEQLTKLTSRFDTRGQAVIGARDCIQFERMKPVFEREDALAFIGFPHVPGVAELFRNEGYTVKQVSA